MYVYEVLVWLSLVWRFPGQLTFNVFIYNIHPRCHGLCINTLHGFVFVWVGACRCIVDGNCVPRTWLIFIIIYKCELESYIADRNGLSYSHNREQGNALGFSAFLRGIFLDIKCNYIGVVTTHLTNVYILNYTRVRFAHDTLRYILNTDPSDNYAYTIT